MSAQVEAVGMLCALAVAAAAVVVPALPAASRRVKAMQVGRERRETEAREIVETSSTSRFEEELSAASPPAQPNYYRSGQYELVQRPPGDTQAWLTQECLSEQAVEVVDEPETVEVVTPAPESWMLPALPDEPTPLFETVKPLPAFEELESFTKGWNRAELLREIRRVELEMAKSDPEPADEELAA